MSKCGIISRREKNDICRLQWTGKLWKNIFIYLTWISNEYNEFLVKKMISKKFIWNSTVCATTRAKNAIKNEKIHRSKSIDSNILQFIVRLLDTAFYKWNMQTWPNKRKKCSKKFKNVKNAVLSVDAKKMIFAAFNGPENSEKIFLFIWRGFLTNTTSF